MKQYVDLIEKIISEGAYSDDRTGTGTIKIFGHQSVYSMDDGFPLLTLKKTWFPGVVHELLWFLGNHQNLDEYKNLPQTNIKYLVDNKVNIWNEWADKDGNLGPVYGKQWKDWGGYDSSGHWNSKENRLGVYFEGKNQIQDLIDKLTEGHSKFNPEDRGLIISAWNVGELDQMALRPCHAFFQFQARKLSLEERFKLMARHFNNRIYPNWDEEMMNRNKIQKYELSLQLYQRSADTFLGVPFNIASYSLLLHMICHVAGMKPGKFIHTFGDAHIYSNHKEQINKLLSRTFEPTSEDSSTFVEGEIFDFFESHPDNVFHGPHKGPNLPKLWLNPEIKNIFDFQYNDIKVLDYNPLPAISAPVAV